MIIKTPLDIDLLTFIATSKFDYVKLGQTKEWIINNFPDPDDTYGDNYGSPIWHYGNIEFHFNENDQLFLIYSDQIHTLNGGPSLQLHKWIFDSPEELTIENVVRHLTKERLGYKLEYSELSNGNILARIEIIESKVELGFALAEIEKENYTEYLERSRIADSNLFRLLSISLTTKNTEKTSLKQ